MKQGWERESEFLMVMAVMKRLLNLGFITKKEFDEIAKAESENKDPPLSGLQKDNKQTYGSSCIS